jgi:signal transduction histidine kinase
MTTNLDGGTLVHDARSTLRALVISDDAAYGEAIGRLLQAQLTSQQPVVEGPEAVRRAPDAAVVVIDGRADSGGATALARRLRGMAYSGAIAVLSTDEAVAGTNTARDGYAVVDPLRLAWQLIPQIEGELVLAASPHAPVVADARRLIAAGERAARLQHALNNPLMGLLAEVQLMQMDGTTDEQSEALERMLGLCRRMVELTRALDGLAPRSSTA